MKISINWLKQFTKVDLNINDLVKKIGAQLGEVEEVIDLGKKYQGIVIARVASCEKHPNADKLSVCKLDDGGMVKDIERDSNGYVQVVCGAPNVRETLHVAWIPPGVAVPSTLAKEPLVLESKELRGVVSNGMIASASELAIGDNHSGIVELEPAQLGTDFAKAYELDDYIIDIENTMFTHRPDCFGILGVAREIAGIQAIQFESPSWYLNQTLNLATSRPAQLKLEVKNNAGNLVPRFMAVVLSDIDVKPSPFKIQTYLARVGLKPINNIVDTTNYIMYLTGQPTHAYDVDKLRKTSGSNEVIKLETRLSHKGEKLKLLGGKEIVFDDNSTVLITSNDVAVGIGGVMGGADTEVDLATKNIVLECANFDMYSIRRTSMKYGLFTDAVTRFNKGQSALQNAAILGELVATVKKLSGGRVSSELIDINLNKNTAGLPAITTTAEFINARLGLNLGNQQISKLLTNVEFTVDIKNDILAVVPPFWRKDIEIAEDLVEEVGRLYGYDHLPLVLPRRSIKPVEKNQLSELKNKIRQTLSKAGANEVLTYSFVHGDLLKKTGQDSSHAFCISNALSPDLQYYRLSLMPSLLDKVHSNIKAGYDEFALFEIGKAHIVGENGKDGLPREDEITALIVAAADKLKKKENPYFVAKKYLEQILGRDLVYKQVPDVMKPFDIIRPYDPNRSALVYEDSKFVGVVGEFRTEVSVALKLPSYCAGFELDTEVLATLVRDDDYQPLLRFPSITQDMTLRTPQSTNFADLKKALDINLSELTNDEWRVELMPINIYQRETHKHYTFRLEASHSNRTLTSKEVNELLNKLATSLNTSVTAERI